MPRKPFELNEYVVATIFLVVAAFDVFVIFECQAAEKSLVTAHEPAQREEAETRKESWEMAHQVLQSLFLTTASVMSIILLIRWYRHHEEMKEAVKESTDKVLEALELQRLLAEETNAALCLRNLVDSCDEILRREWPPFVGEMIVEQLTNSKSKIDAFKAGFVDLDLDTAHRYSPKFFTITKGPSFVTASARNLGYWRTPDGKAQLAANKQAIKSKYGSITRAFIVPNNQIDLLHADIIQEQLNAGVKLIFVNEADVKPDFLCDVGVFLQPCESKVSFMSEWPWPNGDGAHHPARLTFEGERLYNFGQQVYSYFRAHQKAAHVTSFADWETYRKQAARPPH